jgi:hypothetical protein
MVNKTITPIGEPVTRRNASFADVKRAAAHHLVLLFTLLLPDHVNHHQGAGHV